MSLKASYGNGGWVAVQAHDLPGVLYLRYSFDDERPQLTELYLDGQGEEIRTSLLRRLDLAGINAFVMAEAGHLRRRSKVGGPDLSTLASHYATIWSDKVRNNWVADAWRSQYPGQEHLVVKRAPMRSEDELREPLPVEAPRDGLTDDFLRSVAERYLWEVANRRRPAPAIAGQAGVSVRTAQSWFAKARKRGLLGPTTPGKVG